MQLINLFQECNVDFSLECSNKDDALEKLSTLICNGRDFLDKNKVLKVLQDREKLGSTGIGNEVAIPHGKMNIEKQLVGAFAISNSGVDFDALDKKPVKIFFVLIASKDATNIHLKVLAKISRLLMNDNFREERIIQ